MSASTFNAITYANKLKKAGLKDEIADVQAEEMSELINNGLATKYDLQVMARDLEHKIVMRLGSLIIASSGAIVGLLKLFVL